MSWITDYTPIVAAIVGAILAGIIQATFKFTERFWHQRADIPEFVQDKDAELWRYLMDIARERDVEIHKLRDQLDTNRNDQTQTEHSEHDDTH